MPNLYYLIQSKGSKLIQKSSSGGVFAELARYVLSCGGVVFGCTMTKIEELFDVKHIYIEDEKDLYKLQGSKYVQSNLKNTIKEAKEFLEEGRLVLFSGTPCQIAGLKAYLKQDYDNLLTVDLSCTGTPSQEIFNDYIKFLEKKYKQKIINFEFRNKEKMGWCCGNGLITFQDGTQKIIQGNTSAYLNLFITKKIQKECCQNCKFAGLDRISDITLADAWGIDIEYPELLKTKFNQNKGISISLINTQKGEKYIDLIDANLIKAKIDIRKLKKYNDPLMTKTKELETKFLKAYKQSGYKGIEQLFKKDLGIKYYYYKVKNNTPKWIKKIIKNFLPKQEKVDCVLMTWYHNGNYGSILAAFALQQALNSIGFSSKIINHSNFIGYAKAFKKNYNLTKRCYFNKDFQQLNQLSNTFILGSDSIINLEISKLKYVANALFNYTIYNKKRIIISGSIGSWDGTTKNQEEHSYIKYLLDRFDYISTREEHGKEVFDKVFNLQADWINDPVFYLGKQDYIDLTKNIKQDYSNKIMQYVLYPTGKTQNIVEHFKQQTGLEVIKFEGNENVKNFSNYKNKSVENWLAAIINSKIIITDSFHCVAFSLIFNKPFICIKNTHATVRFTSLFKRLGIEVPLIESVEDLENVNLNYDTVQVNKSLDDIRNFALNKIEQAMLTPTKGYIQNVEMEKYNEEFIKNSIPWYKKNKLFYLGIIIPFVIPIKRLMADIKNEYSRKNK